MKLVQIGANKGSDHLTDYLKKYHETIDFGLFVEANSLHIDDLKKSYDHYSNAIIENVAIKLPDHNGDTLKFYYHTKDAPLYEITSCKLEHVQNHLICPHLKGGQIKSFEVACITIEDLFKKYNIKEIDWLLLDVEGIDAEILLTTDWSKYDIKKIEFESLHLGNDLKKIRKQFEDIGYVRTNALHKYDEAWIKNTGDVKMDITLYAICKNEENNVEKFLKNAKKFSNVVVVDTGSTDNTVQLLKDAGIAVYEHPQSKEEFDFSEARNKALSYVETDWAFSLDFNEDVEEFFPEGLDVIEKEFTCFSHLRFNEDSEGNISQSDEVHVRFHRTKNYIWINAVHEIPSFIPNEEYLNESSVDTTIKITKKINNALSKELFYLSICEREHEKNPTEWYYIWFIFNHYYNVRNFEKTLEYGKRFLDVSKPYFDTFRIAAFIRCSQVLFMINEIQKCANYAFHALSEAMNMGEPFLSQAFSHMIELSTKLNNPNITVFATGFSEETSRMQERHEAIDKLFLTNLDDVYSCWKGHRNFTDWLVRSVNPKVSVDLGVDWGFSTFCLGLPKIGKVYGIDNFTGDDFIGPQDEGMKYHFVTNKRDKLFLKDHVEIIKGDFSEVAENWDKKIDILHIDGDHAYESIKRDFETWSKFLSDDGVILMHDTCVDEIDEKEYGVKKFFEELDWPKVNFTHSFGLGVVSRNKNLIEYIEKNIPLDRPL